MPRKYSYYPSFDGKKAQPGTKKLAKSSVDGTLTRDEINEAFGGKKKP